jgi:hypothetical protein
MDGEKKTLPNSRRENIQKDYALRFLEDCIMDEKFETLVIFPKEY